MTEELSPRQSNILLAIWWIGWLCIIAVVVYLATLPAHAVELFITGQASGQGLHLLNFSGDQLNVSISQNASGWNLSVGGQA